MADARIAIELYDRGIRALRTPSGEIPPTPNPVSAALQAALDRDEVAILYNGKPLGASLQTPLTPERPILFRPNAGETALALRAIFDETLARAIRRPLQDFPATGTFGDVPSSAHYKVLHQTRLVLDPRTRELIALTPEDLAAASPVLKALEVATTISDVHLAYVHDDIRVNQGRLVANDRAVFPDRAAKQAMAEPLLAAREPDRDRVRRLASLFRERGWLQSVLHLDPREPAQAVEAVLASRSRAEFEEIVKVVQTRGRRADIEREISTMIADIHGVDVTENASVSRSEAFEGLRPDTPNDRGTSAQIRKEALRSDRDRRRRESVSNPVERELNAFRAEIERQNRYNPEDAFGREIQPERVRSAEVFTTENGTETRRAQSFRNASVDVIGRHVLRLVDDKRNYMLLPREAITGTFRENLGDTSRPERWANPPTKGQLRDWANDGHTIAVMRRSDGSIGLVVSPMSLKRSQAIQERTYEELLRADATVALETAADVVAKTYDLKHWVTDPITVDRDGVKTIERSESRLVPYRPQIVPPDRMIEGSYRDGVFEKRPHRPSLDDIHQALGERGEFDEGSLESDTRESDKNNARENGDLDDVETDRDREELDDVDMDRESVDHDVMRDGEDAERGRPQHWDPTIYLGPIVYQSEYWAVQYAEPALYAHLKTNIPREVADGTILRLAYRQPNERGPRRLFDRELAMCEVLPRRDERIVQYHALFDRALSQEQIERAARLEAPNVDAALQRLETSLADVRLVPLTPGEDRTVVSGVVVHSAQPVSFLLDAEAHELRFIDNGKLGFVPAPNERLTLSVGPEGTVSVAERTLPEITTREQELTTTIERRQGLRDDAQRRIALDIIGQETQIDPSKLTRLAPKEPTRMRLALSTIDSVWLVDGAGHYVNVPRFENNRPSEVAHEIERVGYATAHPAAGAPRIEPLPFDQRLIEGLPRPAAPRISIRESLPCRGRDTTWTHQIFAGPVRACDTAGIAIDTSVSGAYNYLVADREHLDLIEEPQVGEMVAIELEGNRAVAVPVKGIRGEERVREAYDRILAERSGGLDPERALEGQELTTAAREVAERWGGRGPDGGRDR